MTGLDPLITQSLLEYMIMYKNKNKTVLFSSHNLDIVEKICDRVIIINDGRLMEEISMNNLFGKSLTNYFLEKYGV
jgi:sodium transport system ATP-binding protein